MSSNEVSGVGLNSQRIWEQSCRRGRSLYINFPDFITEVSGKSHDVSGKVGAIELDFYTRLLVRHLPSIHLFQRLWESYPVKNLGQTRAANGKFGVSLKKLGIKWLNVIRRKTGWWQLQIADCRIDSIKKCQENEHSWARLTVTSIHNKDWRPEWVGRRQGWGIGQKKVVSHINIFNFLVKKSVCACTFTHWPFVQSIGIKSCTWIHIAP